MKIGLIFNNTKAYLLPINLMINDICKVLLRIRNIGKEDNSKFTKIIKNSKSR